MKLDKIRSAIREKKATSHAASQKLVNAVEQAKASRKLITELKQSIKSNRKALKAAKKAHHAAARTRKKATAILKDSQRKLKKLEAKLNQKSSGKKNGQPAYIAAVKKEETSLKIGPEGTARKVPAGRRS